MGKGEFEGQSSKCNELLYKSLLALQLASYETR